MKISVLTSVFNGIEHLPQALDSILFQTHQDFEFVIINDASESEVQELLNDYANSDRRIRLIHNEQNLGLTKSLNKGLAIASGEYIARMDSDDIAEPQRLERQLAFMEKHPSCGILATQGILISATDIPIKDIIIDIKEKNLHRHIMRQGNPFIHSSLMIRSAVFTELNGYDENLPSRQDLDLLLKTLETHWEISHLPDSLIKYRLHTTSISGRPEVYMVNLVVRLRHRLAEQGLRPSYEQLHEFANSQPIAQQYILRAEARHTLRIGHTFYHSRQWSAFLKTLPHLLRRAHLFRQIPIGEVVDKLTEKWSQLPCSSMQNK